MSNLKYYDGTKWNIVNGQVTGDTLPIGTVVEFAGQQIPTDWLSCDGSIYNISDYPQLYIKIGNTYGGDVSQGTFAVPNYNGRVPVGLNENDTDFDTIGKTGGSKELQAHRHETGTRTGSTGTGGYGAIYQTNSTVTEKLYTSYEGNGDSGNLQPYIVTNYIIKAFQSAAVIAEIENSASHSQINTYSCSYINDLLQTTIETITIGTINAGSGLYDQTSPITIPSGYIPIAIAGYSIAGGSSASINVARLQINGTNIEYSLFNSASSGSSASTSTLNVKILFIKTTN